MKKVNDRKTSRKGRLLTTFRILAVLLKHCNHIKDVGHNIWYLPNYILSDRRTHPLPTVTKKKGTTNFKKEDQRGPNFDQTEDQRGPRNRVFQILNKK